MFDILDALLESACGTVERELVCLRQVPFVSERDAVLGRLEPHATSRIRRTLGRQLLLWPGVGKTQFPLASRRRLCGGLLGGSRSFCATVRVNIEWRVEFGGRRLELVSQPTKGLALLSGL